MPAFGRDQILPPADIENVVSYVRTLSDPAASKGVPAEKIKAGQAVFAANCASCHGDDARGSTETGAPNLTDKVWIYGGDAQTIATTVLERPSGPHADLGRSTVAARPQDSHPLRFRSERGKSMSENIAVSSTALTKARLWLFVGLALLLVAIANWHLVYVAITSEPACVAHVRQGEGTAQPGRFSAAQSSCSTR